MSHSLNEKIQEHVYELGFDDGYNQAILDFKKNYHDHIDKMLTSMFITHNEEV